MAIDDLREGVDMLNDDVGNLGDQVDGLNDDLDALSEEARSRLDALEDPEEISCSAEERCIPDGVEMTRTAIGDMIEIVCEHEVDCCTDAELNLKFGPGITSAEECVALFTDVVNNGLSPNFLGESPYVVYQIIAIAQVLNDREVRVELNREGIEECVDSLRDRECPEYTEPEEGGEPECIENEPYELDPCALPNLLTGLQEEGELCGAYGGGGYYYNAIPECADGLYCAWSAASEGTNRGICAKLPEEGDGCQTDNDCDPVTGEYVTYAYYGAYESTLLYCNIEEAECQPMGDVGDPCTFIDEDFTDLSPSSRMATSKDCKPHLSCSPLTNECVANCNEGFLCPVNSDPFYYCGEGRVCNATEIPELFENFNLGVCTDALETGDTCTPGANECESESCTAGCDLDTGFCECGAPLKQPGDDCTVPGPDPLCITGYCGTNNECVSFCDCDDDVEGYECPDGFVDEFGREPEQCGAGRYCDFSTNINHPDLLGSGHPCQPLIANDTACNTNLEPFHSSCNSGFCDPDPGDDATGPTYVCTAKADANDPCTTQFDEECPNTQYCNAGTCATFLAANAVCTGGLRCAEGLVCVTETGNSTCQPYAESGDVCDNSANLEPTCDPDLDLTCIDIDGDGVGGTEFRCYNLDGGIADGVACSSGNDPSCASGWCKPNAPAAPSAHTCEQPLEEGDTCDTADITLDVCGPGLFCNHPAGETEGKCAAQKEPGESCKPYFGGADCLNGYQGSCVFTKDQFLCNTSAQPEETLFCDGG